jgi:hypothetical protein
MKQHINIGGRAVSLPHGSVLVNGVIVDMAGNQTPVNSVATALKASEAEPFVVQRIVGASHPLENRPFAGLDWRGM